MKKLLSVLLCVVLVAALFAGCSGKEEQTYSDTVLIIGYTESQAPFLTVDENGKATGFFADLWEKIFDDVKGDLKSYRFEKIEEGYLLEDDGGFTDDAGKEYSAGLLMGAVHKNSGTFNEDYSFTEPVITDRVIALTKKDSDYLTFSVLDGAKATVVSDVAKAALDANSALKASLASVQEETDIEAALAALDAGKTDVVITDEFTFCPLGKDDAYDRLGGELDTVEYVIACAKYSGWKDSINQAIYELQSPDYNDADEFTPLVEQHFGYNASSFEFTPKQTK